MEKLEAAGMVGQLLDICCNIFVLVLVFVSVLRLVLQYLCPCPCLCLGFRISAVIFSYLDLSLYLYYQDKRCKLRKAGKLVNL